ncbi:MAG: S53 family peptidase [Candidatus Dormibacter sp.]
MVQSFARFTVRRLASLAIGATAIGSVLVGSPGAASVAALPVVHPMISDFQFMAAAGSPPPSQAACAAVLRRCFNPTSIRNSYNILPGLGNDGAGKTIAVVDSFGSSTMRQDLAVFNTAFGLPHLCGETGPSDPSANCPSTVQPRFDIIQVQGGPPPVPPPPNNGTGLEAHNLWSLEVALDVEWAHSVAPLANIILLTTPTAEVLGVQGFQQMMKAEDALILNHQVDVISQSFGAGEGSFNNGLASLKQLRKTFEDARTNHVTVFASSGDGGSTNSMKTPVKNPGVIPYPSVIWPASDPLVTGVGGTYLCTDAETGLGVDSVSPPGQCQAHDGDREPAWVASGGGYSIYFSRPDFQNVLTAANSSYVGSSPGAPGPNSNMRGVPDVSYNASSRTGVLVYDTESLSNNQAGTTCGGANPCQAGWYTVGGTSASSPQWAGLTALADVQAGHDLGFINPALYRVFAGPNYHSDFYDPHVNTNQQSAIPGWLSTDGWDAVTGIGTPNAAKLIPDLIAAVLPGD